MNVELLMAAMMFLIVRGIGMQMQVLLNNTVGFYYGHRCDLTVTVISDKFIKYNEGLSEFFTFTVLESSEDTRFLSYWTFPYIYRFDGTGLGQARVDNCKRGVATSSFYCASIISSRIAWPEVQLKYNQTHGMYKFTLSNLICPKTNKGIGDSGYHIKFQLDVPVSSYVPDIAMSKNLTYKFTGLKYRMIKTIIANQVTNFDGSVLIDNGDPVQAKNFLVGSDSFLQLNMYLPNQTELNSWETLQMKFIQSPSFLSLDKAKCSLQISFQNQSTLIYRKINESQINCQYVSSTSSFVLKNQNYVPSTYIINQDFNKYELFQAPCVKLKFKVIINFSLQTQIQFSYRVTATTSKQINDLGQLVNISTTTAVLYDSSENPETISGLNSSQYNKIDSKLKAPVVPKNTQNQTNGSNSFMSDFFSNFSTARELPLIAVFAILFVCMLTVCVRKEPWKFQKYVFLIFVLSDLFVKVAIIATINGLTENQIGGANKQVSFILSVFLVIQYGGLGIVLFLTYWLYILAQQRKRTAEDEANTQKVKQTNQSKSSVLIILAMLFNYKFYCVCLFDMKIGKDLKPRRFRNDQLYFKFCWHLSIEIFLILAQIFCVLSSCTYIPISTFFAIHQAIYTILIALIAKSVFRMLALKKMKSKIKKICNSQIPDPQNVANDTNKLKKVGSISQHQIDTMKNVSLKKSQKSYAEQQFNENDLATNRKF